MNTLVYRPIPCSKINEVLELLDVYDFHYDLYEDGENVVVGLTEDNWGKLKNLQEVLSSIGTK